jgi:hypothetical protein
MRDLPIDLLLRVAEVRDYVKDLLRRRGRAQDVIAAEVMDEEEREAHDRAQWEEVDDEDE